MALHHCGRYSTNAYCTCFNEQGEYKDHYKQFNTTNQTYFCCDQINSSLIDLRNYDSTTTGAQINPSSAFEFFTTLQERGITGCSFRDYFFSSSGTSSEKYFSNEYSDLYQDYLTKTVLYNHFIANPNHQPTENTEGFVTCDAGHVPFILEYKSPSQIYYNYAYICSNKSNNVFDVLRTEYGRIDYNIKRFWDFSKNKPCIERTCQLKIKNYGDSANQGNQGTVYENLLKDIKTASMVSMIAASVLLFIWFIFILRHKNVI